MAEYIERGVALREAKYATVRGLDPVAFIEDVPVDDVAPVVHGRWVEYQIPPIICCSNCDWATDAAEKNFQYCPNCGARMDEVE